MELAAGGEPQIDRVAQAFQIDAGPAVDPAQERDRRVGLRPAVIRGEVVEPGLDIAPGDGVEGTAKPVAEMELDQLSIAFIGPHRPVWIGRYVFLEGIAEDGDAARLGAFVRPDRRRWRPCPGPDAPCAGRARAPACRSVRGRCACWGPSCHRRLTCLLYDSARPAAVSPYCERRCRSRRALCRLQ